MKRFSVLSLIVLATFTLSCVSFSPVWDLFKTKVSVKDAVAIKEQIDASANPAQKYLLQKDLAKKRIVIENARVKDVIESANIDYRFTVIVRIPEEKGPVDVYIYCHKEKTVAGLVKGVSIINVVGNFSRFFTLLDDAYTKIELVESSIKLVENQ
jgi:hypothetical protein